MPITDITTIAAKQRLLDPVSVLNGVGPRRLTLYKKLGITTITSLLCHYPRGYLDLSSPVLIDESILDENNVLQVTVLKKQGEQHIRKGLSIFKVIVGDESGSLIVTIFNSKYLFDSLELGEEYLLYGKVTGTLLKREMTSPLCQSVSDNPAVLPIYPLTEGLSNKTIQANMTEALSVWGDCLIDSLPDEIRQSRSLCRLRYAVENIHFPADMNALSLAKERLVFEELLVLSLGMNLLRKKNRVQSGNMLSSVSMDEFYSALPFTLTKGQQEAIIEALSDMSKKTPMNRLIQGDVGSGKTAVAAALCYACAKCSLQSAIMAPTQILAAQHYETFSKLLGPLNLKICLLTGGANAARKKELLSKIASGGYDIVIGTHSLVSESVIFNRLALAVTDEQHRFGVAQRAAIAQKGINPHLLIMSATPIPRTLALLIYGDLDISVIKELPSGRQPIETMVIASKKRGRALGFIKKQLDEGRQAYIVCPLIEESASDLVSLAEYKEALEQTPLAAYEIGILSGKLKVKEKDELMGRFARNEIQLMLATTVIEVGINVPNATVMMVENAERFGLSQLHQLRGRVGRGEHKSYCILVSDNEGEDNERRLAAMKMTTDGFVIAEEDLKLRGPGDFFGLRQHGLPALKLASYYDDMAILKESRTVASDILKKDPKLSKEENQGLAKKVAELFDQNNQTAMN